MDRKNNKNLVFHLISIIMFMLFTAEVSCSYKTGQTLRKSNTQKSLDLMFKNIGTYRGETKDGQFYSKQYYIPKFFQAYWYEVEGICSQYDMEFATFETKEESEKILDILGANGTFKLTNWNYYLVGGVTTVPKSGNDWFWADSGEHIDYNLRWAQNQPDNNDGVEYCLSILKTVLAYNDLPCDAYQSAADSNPQSFICQKKKVLCDA